jgi:hypothetical protein
MLHSQKTTTYFNWIQDLVVLLIDENTIVIKLTFLCFGLLNENKQNDYQTDN